MYLAVDAEYYRRYRAEHPEYRQRQRERARKRRQEGRRGNRSQEYKRRAAKKRLAREQPTGLDTDPMLQRARAYAAKHAYVDGRTSVKSDLYDELVSEVLLAMVTKESRAERVQAWKRENRTWHAHNITGSGEAPPETHKKSG